ncbi:hypothetical protein BJX64DRAFT_290311 [Aspergillus heterothallicus]
MSETVDLTSHISLVTGGANSIGAAVVTRLNSAGATVIVVDLASTEHSAQQLIASLPQPANVHFFSADIAHWAQLRAVFTAVKQRFGKLDFVVACAGTMEHYPILEDRFDEFGELEESMEAYRTIDVNLNGSLNSMLSTLDQSFHAMQGNHTKATSTIQALKLALHHIKSSTTNNKTNPIPPSITLIASTAGYFDGAGTLAYTASKHGVVGLLRASQSEARKHGIRVNAIAPFFTTTHMTSGIAQGWVTAGIEVNSPEAVAKVIVETAVQGEQSGVGVLVSLL